MSDLPWILGTVALVVTGQMLLKIGMVRVGAVSRERLRAPFTLFMDVVGEPLVVIGIVVYGLSGLLWLYVLSRAELSFAFPFLSLAYAGVTAAATIFLHEHFSARQWFGLVLVMGGVAAVALSGT